MSDPSRVPLSVVIPAYNEAERISPTLVSIAAYFWGETVEVVVVDDGSTDGTAEVVRRHEPLLPGLRVVELPRNRGKGHAVRAGMLEATGAWRLMMDADGSTDVTEFARLEDEVTRTGAPVVVASIAVPGAEVVRPQPGLRPALGRLANRFIQRLALPGIHDSQRGFKLFRGDVAEQVFGRSRVEGWGFDVEVLALARALGHEIVEVGVRWEHREDSRVRPFGYFATLFEVVGVRRRVRTLARQVERHGHPVPVPATAPVSVR